MTLVIPFKPTFIYKVRSERLPVVGLEPTTLAGRDFESRAYANSATPAS